MGQNPLQQQTSRGLASGEEGDAGLAQVVESLVFET